MATEGYLVDEYTLRDFVQFYVAHNNMDGVNRTLNQCKTELPEHYDWILLSCIKELAIFHRTNEIQLLLPQLCPSSSLEFAIEKNISRYVGCGVSSTMPEIFVAAKVDVTKFCMYLMHEMVNQAVSAKELHQTWDSLKNIDVTISSHFIVYSAAVRSQSMLLIHAVLYHMHSNGMQIDDDDFKGIIQLSAENCVESMLRTIKELRQFYGFKPQSTFIQQRILSEFPWKHDPSEAVNQLCSTGLSRRSCVVAIINAFLAENDIDRALNFAQMNVFYFYLDIIVMPLIDAYFVSRDTENFVKFVRLIFKSIRQFEQYKRSEYKFDSSEDVQQQQTNLVEQILEAILTDKRMNKKMTRSFLIYMEKENFSVSERFFDKFVKTQMIDWVNRYSDLLKKLVRPTISGKSMTKTGR